MAGTAPSTPPSRGYIRRSFNKARSVTRSTLKWGFRAAAAGIGVSAAISAGALMWGQDATSEPIHDYLKRTGQSEKILATVANSNIRVYRHTLLTPFYQAGRTGADALKEIWTDPGASRLGKTVQTPFVLVPYTDSLLDNLLDAAVHIAWNAHTIPVNNPKDICYIRPPDDNISMKEAAQALSGLPQKLMRDIPGDSKNAGRDAIMAHEAVHCDHGQNEPFKSAPLEHEMRADLEGMRNMAEINGGSRAMTVFKYARAVSIFSQPGFFDQEHATALLLDAVQRGAEPPTREEVYYANGELSEIVNRALAGYDEEEREREPYYRAVYREMQNVIAARTANSSPLVIRAAQLYIEGVDYLIDANKEKSLKSEIRAIPALKPH
jgi:hypothetical protein